MILKYDSSKLCAENIFTEDCPPYLIDLRAYLRGNTNIAICIRGSARTESYFQDLEAQLQQDKEKEPPRSWYPENMKRPVIQKGMYFQPNERPSIASAPAVYTSFDWLDNMMRNGFARIYEREHTKTIQDPFSEMRHDIFFELAGRSY